MQRTNLHDKVSLTDTEVQAGSMRMRMRVAAGQAERPVVLVHGFVVSGRYMIPTARRLAPAFQVYVPDLPGFGGSEKPPDALTLVQLADVLADWVDAAGLDRAVLLGNSFGCQVIVEFALRYPERAAALILVSPTVDPERRSMPQQLIRLLLDAPELLNMAPLLLRDLRDIGLHRTLQTLRYMLQDRIEEKLPQVSVPTLVVRGEWDPIVSQRWAVTVSRLLPAGRLVVLPRARHTPNCSASSALVRAIRLFLEEVC